MDELSGTTGIVALAAAAVALGALVLAIVLAVRLRRMRAAQAAVLGPSGQQDLVSHASRLEQAFSDLREWVEEAHGRIDERMLAAEGRIDGCVAYTALVRYDAYNEMSGQQSSSYALLDSHSTGVVVSSILHRDQARVYVKRINEGEPDLELSPEEREAVEQALGASRA